MLPAPASAREMTDLLAETGYWQGAQLAEVAPLLYEELHRLAHSYMTGERAGHTLQTTALVNEAYLRLADRTSAHWADRSHFFAGAARVMRHILVDYARNRQSAKRGDGVEFLELNEASALVEDQASELVELSAALERLEQLDRRASQVVELKYFGGMNHDEIAAVLGVSAITVRRDWEFARAWLQKELEADRGK